MSDSASTSTVNNGDTAWILASTALVFLMVPGLGYFYSGMAHEKNALTLIFLSLLCIAVVTIEWFIWGFSLVYSPTGGPFLGNLNNAFGIGIDGKASPLVANLPNTVYYIYQLMFAIITPCLAFGAAVDRIRLAPAVVWIFVWSTLVYDVIAHWTWGPGGWSKVLGGLDFAGGTPVHISSGFAALAYALFVGRRLRFGEEDYKPSNYSNVMLGTALLWFGWFGFNAGSALAANGSAGQAAITTNLAAATGGMAWCLLGYRHHKKLSSFGFCCGAVAGLVAITPGAGYVSQ